MQGGGLRKGLHIDDDIEGKEKYEYGGIFTRT